MMTFSLTGETVAPWYPLPNLAEDFFFTRLDQTPDGVHIFLESEGGRLLHVESNRCLGLRTTPTDFSDRCATACEQELLPFGRFWQVLSSTWSASISGRGEGAPETSAIHVMIVTSELIIEILSDQELHVSWDDNFFGDAL